jgi:chromosomal replication initiation ATPase DnaA
VAQKFRIEPDILHTRTVDGRLARKVALELSCRYSGQSQRKVGEYYGYKGNGSVLKQRQKLKELLGADSGLQQKMTALTRTLGRA